MEQYSNTWFSLCSIETKKVHSNNIKVDIDYQLHKYFIDNLIFI